MAEEFKYQWTDNCCVSGVAICDTDVLNDCLMHLKYDKKDGGTGLQMFDTILKDRILTYEESKGLALQGTYVYKEALAGSRYGYPDFYNKVIEEFNQATTIETLNGVTVKVHSNGHKFYNIADKTGIDEFFNAMGTAWFYGVDTTNERIFLPRNNYFDQATGDISEVGKSIEAGLPNITGGFNAVELTDGTQKVSGAFIAGGMAGQPSGTASDGSQTGFTFDASLSNPIYSNSDTVQPNAVKKLLYICVGNTTNYEGVSEVVNQGMDILEQINEGFVQKDSMREVPCIMETYINRTSGYNVWSNGYCEQWGRSGNSANLMSVTLLKPYKDINYNIVTASNPVDSRNGYSNEEAYVNNVTVNGFKIWTMTSSYSKGSYWKTCGYIA